MRFLCILFILFNTALANDLSVHRHLFPVIEVNTVTYKQNDEI